MASFSALYFALRVSDKPEDVIPEADIILVAAPANAHPSILKSIAPHIRQGTYLGTIYAQGGFDWAAQQSFSQDFSSLAALFGLQNIPWLCRTTEYGREANIGGPKDYLVVAATPQSKTRECADLVSLLFDIPSKAAPNFLTLTLSPSNQIIHPARYYAIFKDWDGQTPYKKEDIAWGLYTEFDPLASEWLEKLDSELQKIKEGLTKRFPNLDLDQVYPIKYRIENQYGDAIGDKSSLLTVFRTNQCYAGCVTPAKPVDGGYIPATQSRLFWEDIPYGLCILHGIAELLAIPTPSIDFMIKWHEKHMQKLYLVDGRLNKETLSSTAAPQAYGISTLEALVKNSLPQ